MIGQAWYVRGEGLGAGRFAVCCVQNEDHPDGTTIDAAEAGPPDPAELLWIAGLDEQRRSHITVTAGAAPDAPDAWFVMLKSKENDRPRVTLVAFATDHLPDGTVVPDAAFFTMPVRSESQGAAIRWWVDTAIVDEIFVQPEHRRSHLGTKLIYAASAMHQHHGWPDRLHSDGRRTDIGQQFVVGLRHPHRMADWTERAGPMDRESEGGPVE